ncbi:MAG: alpha/beta hydrolase [Hyphomicrobiales bacterium]|nr:alpha/beta hydrolase [Hyphomicrobiales bacterium]
MEECVERTHSLALKGVDVSYWRAGAGAPVLYLDAEDSYGGREPFLHALAQGHDVVAPEHPGFGRTATPDWLKTMGDLALFYLELIEALNIGPVHVVGASLGGWAAAEAAVRSPHLFKSITLLAPLGLRALGTPFGDVFIWTPPENARGTFHSAEMAQAVLDRPMSREDTAAALQSRYATTRLGWSPRFFSPELTRWTDRLRAPVHLVWGDEDQIAPIAIAKSWTDALPHARLSRVPACGHLPHVEHPQAVADKVASFIREAH